MPALKFLSFHPDLYGPGLWPAPNIREVDEINAELEKDTMERQPIDPEVLTNKSFGILADYRGYILYLQGGLRVNRSLADGVNGYCYYPVKGQKEEVRIGDWWADVEYV